MTGKHFCVLTRLVSSVNFQMACIQSRFSDTSRDRRSAPNLHTQPEHYKSASPAQSVHTYCRPLHSLRRCFLFSIAENALLSLTNFAICCKYPSSDGNSIDISIIKLDLSNNLYFVLNNKYCSVYRVVFLYV